MQERGVILRTDRDAVARKARAGGVNINADGLWEKFDPDPQRRALIDANFDQVERHVAPGREQGW